MLEIVIPYTELYSANGNQFIEIPETRLLLEHSLVSLAKWESKWNKAFLTKKPKTDEETRDYIRCMTLNNDVDPRVYDILTKKNIEDIYKYINAPMTALYIPKESEKKGKDTVIAELIYYWMISLNIPVEFERWHINRLFALIHVCNIKNEELDPNKKKKKRNVQDIARNNAEINERRLQQYNTTG